MEPEACADCGRSGLGLQITWGPLWQVHLCAADLWRRTQIELWKECAAPDA